MKVFISWSGKHSQQIAQALHDWLPLLFAEVTPFMSAASIEAGSRWNSVIASNLEETGFGIICVARDNVDAPWLNFEAGALAKKVDQSNVIPLTIDLAPGEVQGPLSQFNGERLGESGVWSIVKLLNDKVTNRRTEGILKILFDRLWPDLRAQLDAVVEGPSPEEPAREEYELLVEIVERVRNLEQKIQATQETRGDSKGSGNASAQLEVLRRLMAVSDSKVTVSPVRANQLSKQADRWRREADDGVSYEEDAQD